MTSKLRGLTAALTAIVLAAGNAYFPIAPRTRTARAAQTIDPRILVDINANDGRKPSYTTNANNWNVDSGTSASTTINGMTFTLSNGGSVGSGIKSGNCKLLQKSDGTSPTLTMDGVTIDGGENGGTIKLEIKGLSAGTHSLKTWNSCHDGKSISTMTVSVNGQTTYKGIKSTTRVTNDEDAGMSYSTFEVTSGQTVTVLIKPDGNGTVNNAYLNAFEIDGSDPFNGASRLSPANMDTHRPIEDGLTWTAGNGAQSHDIYIGTDFASIYNADHSSPTYMGNQKGTEYALDDSYSSLLTYYWRVDEVGSNGTVKGSVNSFQVARLAFPTAEGYGRYARGGQGGKIVEVTNLNDSGAGSLRQALEVETGPRIVVFRVGGVIELKSKITIDSEHGDVYVAGQTAPGDGITVIKYGIGALGANDVIIRDLHVRVGDSNGKGSDGMGLGSCNNCIIDHCSISWGTDEGFSSRGARNITFQRNIIAESLNNSVHYDANDRTQTERHAFAASISGDVGSFHHNLLIHCTDRNWSLAGGLAQDVKSYQGSLDLTNNVIYNWRNRTTDGGIGRVQFVNNYYKMGPVSRDMALLVISDNKVETPQKAYVSGNRMTDQSGNTKLDPSQDAWSQSRAISTSQTVDETRSNSPFWESYINIQSADDAYKSVLADVGANAQKVDQYDSRYINEVKNGTYTYTGSKDGLKGIIDSQNDVGGYPNNNTFKGGTAYTDSDHDGISDEWETAHGLNPNDASDGSVVSLSAEGYTNVEMFINELAGEDIRITEIKREPLNGTLITNLEIKDNENYADWSIKSGLQAGDLMFGDREVTYKEFPTYLSNAEYICSACDSKTVTGSIGSFTAGADITAYIVLDNRVEDPPAWLSKWEDTGEDIVNSKDVTFSVYKKDFAAGETVSLGTNGQSSGCVGYTVIVTLQGSAAVIGDVNADGTFSIADALLLEKWLLAVPDTELADWKAGDLCEDGRLNAFDLVSMKALLVSNSNF